MIRHTVTRYRARTPHAASNRTYIVHTAAILQIDNPYTFRNFHHFSTTIKSETQSPSYQSLKDEYASSPFRKTSGTSIDPVFDPDSIAHPETDENTPRSPRRDKLHMQRAMQQSKLSRLKQVEPHTTTAVDETEEDIEQYLDASDITDNINKQIKNDFNDKKQLPQHKIIPGWKKRQKKMEKYHDHIIDPLDRPMIHRKRVFQTGDKCEGCGAVLQNEDTNKIGYVDNIINHERHDAINTSDEAQTTDPETEMKDIYIPDHQRLLLIDLGIMEKNQKYLKYDQYLAIQEGNKKANRRKKEKVVLEKAICSRCFQLENYKRIKRIKDNTIIPEEFTHLLTNRFARNKVNLQQICIIKLVDVFDFHGSFIANLNDIIHGKEQQSNAPVHNENVIKQIPIILAINKVDLLTENVRKPANHDIIIDWAWNECKRFNFRPASIITICSKTGYNVDLLLDTAIKATPIRTSIKRHPNLTTAERYRDIYVIGTTNVGKSTLINQWLRKKLIYSTQMKTRSKMLTTSVIPATTMGIIPFLVKGHLNTRLLDTPGVIDEHNLCLKLTDDEYKMLILKKPVKPITYKIKSGQSIILGSLGRLDCDCISDNEQENVNDGRDEPYFYFTIFVAPMCSVHVTKIDRAEEVVNTHCGNMLRPVNSVERILDDPSLEMEKKQTWSLDGIGLQAAVCDVVFPGIGWIALTGKCKIQFTAHSIKDLKVGVRKPLLARDMYRNVKKYQGMAHKKW